MNLFAIDRKQVARFFFAPGLTLRQVVLHWSLNRPSADLPAKAAGTLLETSMKCEPSQVLTFAAGIPKPAATAPAAGGGEPCRRTADVAAPDRGRARLRSRASRGRIHPAWAALRRIRTGLTLTAWQAEGRDPSNPRRRNWEMTGLPTASPEAGWRAALGASWAITASRIKALVQRSKLADCPSAARFSTRMSSLNVAVRRHAGNIRPWLHSVA